MKLVRIIMGWSNWLDLMKQTPGHSGNWHDLHFTLDPVNECDYVVILNSFPEDTVVTCPPEHVWAIMQEPPSSSYRKHLLRSGLFSRVYTPDVSLQGDKYIQSHGSIPWHVKKDYDTLKSGPLPVKTRVLSWITSAQMLVKGHRRRMAFLHQLQRHTTFDLWGWGFTPIEDKWDGLAPYRYALAVENHSGPFYWSEKLADCFLSWTMPIYYGCENLEAYFPAESFVRIDIQSPDAIRVIQEVIKSDLWLKNREAIAYARELVLDKYQLFPFVANEIQLFESRPSLDHNPSTAMLNLPAQPTPNAPLGDRVARRVRRWLRLEPLNNYNPVVLKIKGD